MKVHKPEKRLRNFVRAVTLQVYGNAPRPESPMLAPVNELIEDISMVVGDSVLVNTNLLSDKEKIYLLGVVEKLGYKASWGSDYQI